MNYSEVITFTNPAKINVGFRALETIPMELTWLGASHPMLLFDPNERHVERTVLKGFQGAQMALLCHRVEHCHPQPDAIAELSRAYKSNGCDAIIACGGPDLLDLARLLYLVVSKIDPAVRPSMRSAGLLLRPLVCIVTDAGQVLRLTEKSVVMDTRTEADAIMPSLIVIDDRLSAAIKWYACLPNALATLALAAETLALGEADHFKRAYARSALRAVVTHLPTVLSKSGGPFPKTALASAELWAGLAAGTRRHHPSWLLGNQMAMQTDLPMGTAAALVLPSALAQARTLPHGRPDLLLSAMGDFGPFETAISDAANQWDQALGGLITFIEKIRRLKPNAVPSGLPRSAWGIEQVNAVAAKTAGQLDDMWDGPKLCEIVKDSLDHGGVTEADAA